MRLKKRKKYTRVRGTRTHGWAMKKHKGSGNRGGKGMSGTGKRGDQRKTYVLRYLFPYFGKQGYTSRSTKRKMNNVINLSQIASKFKPGEVDLSEFKILGTGELGGKYSIKAKSFSEAAKLKIEKSGGKAILAGKEVKEKKQDKK
jgi:large subunit ribosomal protein L15